MNYANRLREIDENIEKLKKIRSDLEKARDSAENSGSIDMLVRNFGFMYKMTNDLAMGYLIESMGQMGIDKNNITIADIDESIQKISSEINKAQNEYIEVQAKQQQTQKNVELIVEDDKIYINGDAQKNDILSEVKKQRAEVIDKLENLMKDESFSKLIQTKNELVELLKRYNYPSSQEMSKMLNNIYERTSYGTLKDSFYNKVGGFVFPTYDFSIEAREDLKAQIGALNNKLIALDEEFRNFKPSFWGRIFSSAREKQKEEKRFDYVWDRNKLTSKIHKLEETLNDLNNLSENVFGPYFSEIQPKVASFTRMMQDKDVYEYAVKQYETLVKKLNTNTCFESKVYGIKAIFSEDVTNYLEENNLHITDQELYKALNKLSKKYDAIKEEILPRCNISLDMGYDM